MAIDYVDQLRHNGELMAVAAERDLGSLDSHVPSCPEWNVGKLVAHTGQHHRWVADAIRRGGRAPGTPEKPGKRGAELIDWFREGWTELAELLEGLSGDEPAWSWSTEQTTGFWRRRTALETLVHRWDAENATGDTSALDSELAADGIDEMLFVMMTEGEGTFYEGAPMVVRLSPVDEDQTWYLHLEDGQVARASRDDANAVLDLKGRAEDLLLYLWGRKDRTAITDVADQGLSDGFERWLRS